MKIINIINFILCFCFFCSCKESFVPHVDPQNKNLLVVEGYINIGGETTIQLSRTGDLMDWRTIIPEKNANVLIEGKNGTILKAVSVEDGKYFIDCTSLQLSETYRLKITTNNGSVYQTDFLENKVAPAIDSLSFFVENNGFQIGIDTHDDTKKTIYYHWKFEETWEIVSPYPSGYEYQNGQVIERDKSINIQNCWIHTKSSNIILANTEKLAEDKLLKAPIHYIKGNSVKLSQMYSINVKQYGVTKEAFQYLEQLKKNSESVGGIFDPQPTEIKGNIVCVTQPQEQVLGWVSAGKESSKRIFISYKDKPSGADWIYSFSCEAIESSLDNLFYFLNANKLIISETVFQLPSGAIVKRYSMSDRDCIDCRFRGTNVKPNYWPN